MEAWRDYVQSLVAAFDGLQATSDAMTVSPAEGLRRWVEKTREIHARGRNVYLIGNGGSAAMASHFAADASKNAHLRAQAFNDASLITAVSNDVDFADVFAEPLRRLAQPGDMLISISSSGRSPNIVRALKAAAAIPMEIVTLSGKGADNPSRTLGGLNFYVPSPRYGFVESAHAVILHYWIDQYLNAYGKGAV